MKWYPEISYRKRPNKNSVSFYTYVIKLARRNFRFIIMLTQNLIQVSTMKNLKVNLGRVEMVLLHYNLDTDT